MLQTNNVSYPTNGKRQTNISYLRKHIHKLTLTLITPLTTQYYINTWLFAQLGTFGIVVITSHLAWGCIGYAKCLLDGFNLKIVFFFTHKKGVSSVMTSMITYIYFVKNKKKQDKSKRMTDMITSHKNPELFCHEQHYFFPSGCKKRVFNFFSRASHPIYPSQEPKLNISLIGGVHDNQNFTRGFPPIWTSIILFPPQLQIRAEREKVLSLRSSSQLSWFFWANKAQTITWPNMPKVMPFSITRPWSTGPHSQGK